jgi:hypothetical protein
MKKLLFDSDFIFRKHQRVLARYILIGLCTLSLAPDAGALDFGAVLENDFITGNVYFDNKVTASVWLKYLINKKNRFFLSLETVNENNDSGWTISSPVISAAGFFFRPLDNILLEAGRIKYQDHTGIIADGLFDGVHAVLLFPQYSISASVLYSGLLQKDQTKIIMSAADLMLYNDVENYFAPKKIFAALEAKARDLFEYKNIFYTGIITQVDLTRKSALNNQYFDLKAVLPFSNSSNITAGSIFGLSQENNNNNFQSASFISVNFGLEKNAVSNVVSFGFLWSSGPGDKGFGAFFPITYAGQGEIFTPNTSNLLTLKMSYTLKHTDLFEIKADAVSFFRTSFEIPFTNLHDESDESALGQELYMTIKWKPLTDGAFKTGFGLFFPNEYFYKDYFAPLMWKFSLSLVINT